MPKEGKESVHATKRRVSGAKPEVAQAPTKAGRAVKIESARVD